MPSDTMGDGYMGHTNWDGKKDSDITGHDTACKISKDKK